MEYQTFQDLGVKAKAPDGYKCIYLHPVFDCKHDFLRKARIVAGGNRTDPPTDSTYSSVVSLCGMWMDIFIGELNNLQVVSGDIGNAYLTAFTTEQVCSRAGHEFSCLGLEGHILIIVRALYGLKSSGARFHDLLADVLNDIGFDQCKAEPDIWLRDRVDHWEYVATYVDDLLYVGQAPYVFFQHIATLEFKLKGVGEPSHHLGGDFRRIESGNSRPVLTWGPTTFVIKMLLKYEHMFGEPVPKRSIHAPLEPGDHHESDLSPL